MNEEERRASVLIDLLKAPKEVRKSACQPIRVLRAEARGPTMRCHCGRCRRCGDNALRDRLFQSKMCRSKLLFSPLPAGDF
jgi:hypothetical protein